MYAIDMHICSIFNIEGRMKESNLPMLAINIYLKASWKIKLKEKIGKNIWNLYKQNDEK